MTSYLSKLSLTLIFSCLLFLLGMLLVYQINVTAQQQCPNIPKFSFAQWRPNATITVYFDESYYWSAGTKTAIQRAFLNWSAANGPNANNSGVTFVGFQNGPYPNRNTAKDLFIVTKSANATEPNGATVSNSVSGGFAAYGRMEFPTSVNLEPPSYDPEGTGLTGTAAHEIGHTFNLGDCYACSGTVMCSACGVHGPTGCDNCAVNAYNAFPPTLMACSTPAPTPTPRPTTQAECQAIGWSWNYTGSSYECFPSTSDECEANGFYWNFTTNSCSSTSTECMPDPHHQHHCLNCASEISTCTNWDSNLCQCNDGSPILIDISGNGFSLTNAIDGVRFDLRVKGVPERFSWTSAQADDAW
ncbi:MAG: hypothetical protein WCB68_21205, partial [Pyrinomonadaceae bacterium]